MLIVLIVLYYEHIHFYNFYKYVLVKLRHLKFIYTITHMNY